LLEALTLSGFYITPLERQQMLQVLAGPAKLYLDRPERLKYLLAPVICRNAAEQARFYEVFDKYYREEGRGQGAGKTVRRSPFTWIALAVVIGLLGYWVVWRLGPAPEREVIVEDQPEKVIGCDNPPAAEEIVAPTQADPGREVRFSIAGTPGDSLRYRWVMSEKDTLNGPRVVYTFPDPGTKTALLIIDRPGAAGDCRTEVSHSIQVGPQQVFLHALPLLKAPLEPHMQFAIGTWLLFGILGLGALVFWLKWLARKPKDPRTQQPNNLVPDRFSTIDRGPYFIPFRSRDPLIHPSREPMRLADVLRRRQEGLRLEVDVPASVNATIRQGGFPALKERYNTQPTDYLFLVDEQSPASHQARLFHYLVEMLQERDVHLEAFFFKNDPGRVWNAGIPGGIALEQLLRIYPVHRLVVLGEGYGMLDPHSVEQHQVRTSLSAPLRAWKQRMLLTPVPPRAWGFREAALQQMFVVFPADLQGMAQAAGYLESDLDTNDLPLTFKAWKEQLEAQRTDPDPQFRRWRTAGEHREYLRENPELFRWLCATAVYPRPNWDLTLAVGEALSLKFTYDDLLLFSRIPWLQTGNLHPRLREELLEFASDDDEMIARAAVRRELAAVAEASGRGAANLELQSHLAIQEFALEPGNTAFRDTIRQLLDQGLITRKQEAELDQVVRRKSAPIAQQSNISQAFQQQSPGIREYLQDQSPITNHQSRPLWTPAFKWALACSALWVALFFATWVMIGRNTLDKVLSPTAEGRHFFFVKEGFLVDSAVIYNNKGVDAFYKEAVKQGRNTSKLNTRGRRSEMFFQKAVHYGSGLPLADTNLLRLYYNLGVENYLEYQNGEGGRKAALLMLAREFFGKAEPLPEATHALGVAGFFLNNTALARQSYDKLMAGTDSLFFDTTSIFPNLETLLFPKRSSEIVDVKIKPAARGSLEIYVTWFNNQRLYPGLSLEATPLLSNEKVPKGFMPATKVIEGDHGRTILVAERPNYLASTVLTASVRVRLRAAGGYVVDERIVPFKHIWKNPRQDDRRSDPTPQKDLPPVDTGRVWKK